MKERRIRRINRSMVGLLLLAGCLLFQVRGEAEEGKEDRLACEEEYLLQIRSVLEREGYSDRGLMLNYVREPDGRRDYTLTVHHERIERSGEERKNEILKALADIPFGVDNSTISGEFSAVP